MGLLDYWTDTIGVDPGSQNLRIVKDGELVFNEPSRISIDKTANNLSGLGNSVRATSNDVILNPVNYSIWDFHAFEMMLRKAVQKASGHTRWFPRAHIMHFCIPTNTNEVEKRAYRDSGEHANAKEVYMIHQSCSSAIGLNILFEKRNFVIIDFGSSKIEMTVFSDSVPIAIGELRLGTRKILDITRNYLRRTYKLDVSDSELQDFFKTMAKPLEEFKIRFTTIKAAEIQDLLESYFSLVNDIIIETFENVSNHADIRKILANGVYFTGGGSTFEYLRRQIKLMDGVPFTLSKTPLLDNINGLKVVMANKEKFRNYLMT